MPTTMCNRKQALCAVGLAFVGGACGSSSHATAPDGGTPPLVEAGGTLHDANKKPEASASHREASAPINDATSPTNDGSTPVADGSHRHDVEAGAVVPTVSSWIGTNVDADLPFADVTYLMSGFNTAAADLDANGYPVAGASGTSSTDMGFELPTGTYNISYVGTGTLAVSGIGALVSSTWTTAGGEQRNRVTITGTPGSFGNFLTLTVTNTGTKTVTAIHLYLPGIDYDPTSPFNPQFITALTPFRAMRFMDWEATNNSTIANWSDYPSSTQFGSSTYGHPYDLMAELINETGKDGWITVPEHATADFITQFATLMATKLDFDRIANARAAAGFTTPFQLIVENSNETWNSGFTAYTTFLDAANMDTTRYTGTYTGTSMPTWMSGNSDLMKVAQYEADRLVSIGQAFTTALQAVGHADALAPVLSGWALGAAYSDEGLSFIKANYGAPKSYVTYVALAPYFDTADDTTTGSLSTIFPALVTGIQGNAAIYPEFVSLGTEYSVSIATYEGGQSLTGTTNQTIKQLAQFDTRMNATYQTYLESWKQAFGTSLFMHFNLTGTPGEPENIYQYGFWGSLTGVSQDVATCGQNLPTLTGTETVASVMQYCPKYSALASHVPE
jgi:hypothetical protein